jgi:AcrR family transcriptional regulator
MVDEEMGPRQRGAETKRRRTRELIIVSTLELYDGKAEGDHTRDEIAAAAGVGVATVHNNFGSKYEVLRAAYDRLLSPLIDTILEAQKQRVYNPSDGIDELFRYVYTVAKVSHENRALTVSMIRSYFDLSDDDQPYIPASINKLTDEEARHFLNVVIGGKIVEGLYAVIESRSFPGYYLGDVRRTYLNSTLTLFPIVDALLMKLFHRKDGDVPVEVTRDICTAILAVALPEDDWSDVMPRVNAAKELVDRRA